MRRQTTLSGPTTNVQWSISPRTIILLAAGVYVAVLLTFAHYGYLPFVQRSTFFPIFVIVALVSRRFEVFVVDWLLFLSLMLLFESLRGLVYGWVVAADRTVWAHYPLMVDALISPGGASLSAHLQGLWFDGTIGWLERVLVLVHASHFVFFLGFGFWLWMQDRQDFRQYTWAVLIVFGGGLIGYAAIPTAPPWMATEMLPNAATVTRIPELVYTVIVPQLYLTFDVNPVAAMPSIHIAFPTLVGLVATRLRGAAAVWIWAYVALVALALVYLGEHYLLDIAAGIILAAVAFSLTYRTSLRRSVSSGSTRLSWQLVVISLILLLAASALGDVAVALYTSQ